MKDFLSIPADNIIYRNEHFFIIEDAYPVSPGHLLIISNVVRSDYFNLTSEEQHSLVAFHNIDVRSEIEFDLLCRNFVHTYF